MKKTLLLILVFLYGNKLVFAQTSTTTTNNDFYNMSLEDLMNVKVSVASIKGLTTRESPGIVSLITEEEIQNSGARDLMEILITIPGFDFGVDVEGVIGLGVRGNWAHEGKFLLLIDGLEMNENLFATTQFGNHYPVENIKQIEIIRGPGSAMYGGYAEYAVINIITRSGGEINGISAGGSVSSTSKGISGSRTAISAGKSFKDFSFTTSGYMGSVKRSDRNYTDLEGNSFDMNSNSEIRNYYTNTALEYKKFQLRVITDNYHMQTRDYYGTATSKAYVDKFDSYFIQLKRDCRLHSKLNIYPKITYKKQLPWNLTEEAVNEEIDQYNILSEKLSASLASNYDPSEKISISAGIDDSFYKATTQSEGTTFSNGNETFGYFNASAFLQGLFRMGFADFTIGARYNYNSRFNSSFVPRIGMTKVFKKFHFKCLYSNAFRTPSTENINYGVNIQPEKTAVFEIEGGMQLSEKMFVTINTYSIRTSNTIVYYYDVFNETDGYKNFYGSGTQGIELVYKIKDKWGWAEMNYAYYNAKNNFRLENYEVPGNENVLIGFPAHKINIKGNIKLAKNWNVSPSATYSSAKYDFQGKTNDGQSIIKKYPALVIGNLFINHENFLIKGLQAGIGIYNLFNQAQYFFQPYNSMHAPLPGQSREFAVKILYDLKF